MKEFLSLKLNLTLQSKGVSLKTYHGSRFAPLGVIKYSGNNSMEYLSQSHSQWPHLDVLWLRYFDVKTSIDWFMEELKINRLILKNYQRKGCHFNLQLDPRFTFKSKLLNYIKLSIFQFSKSYLQANLIKHLTTYFQLLDT